MNLWPILYRLNRYTLLLNLANKAGYYGSRARQWIETKRHRPMATPTVSRETRLLTELLIVLDDHKVLAEYGSKEIIQWYEVCNPKKVKLRTQALAKLTYEEREALNIS